MKTFYFKVLLRETMQMQVVSTSGQTFYEAQAKANVFGKVLETLPFGRVSPK
jgi:hypothetical protein